MYCKKCGKILNQGEKFCTSCGAMVEDESNIITDSNTIQENQTIYNRQIMTNNVSSFSTPTQNLSYNVNVQQVEPNNTQYANNTNNKSGKSLASLILGILTIVLSFIFSIFVIPVAIVGLILGLLDKNKSTKKVVGIILNVCGIILPIILLFLFILRANINLDSNGSGNISEDNGIYDEENVINDEELSELMDSLKAWNKFDDLRNGNLGKVPHITGGWRILSEYETYWEFKDGKFWWYKSVDDLNDNYWYGTTKIVTGKKGIKSIGLDENKIDTIVSQSEGQVTADDIYAIVCTPIKVIIDGQDKSSTNIQEGAKWNYVWVIVDHGDEGIEAQVFNVNTYEVAYYVKIKD